MCGTVRIARMCKLSRLAEHPLLLQRKRGYALPRQSMWSVQGVVLACTVAQAVARAGRGLAAHAPAFSTCALHKLPSCPGCHPQEYVAQRVSKAVLCGLKRLGLPKTKTVLEYLGARTWSEVYEHLDRKREGWNARHPHARMTWTNAAIDHIRPVDAFRKRGAAEDLGLCNHLSNLQPLLLQDNAWKGHVWGPADEAFWRAHILHQTAPADIYFPQARAPLSLIERGAGLP